MREGEEERALSTSGAVPSLGVGEGRIRALPPRVPITHPMRVGSLWTPFMPRDRRWGLSVGLMLAPACLCPPPNSPSASLPVGASGPRYISRDWRGVPGQLDAAMAGRIYVASQQPRRRKSRRQRKRYKSQRSLNLGLWSWLQNDSDSMDAESDWLSGSKCETLQSVYFFVGGEAGELRGPPWG